MVLSANPVNENYVAVDFDPFAEGELVNTAAATESNGKFGPRCKWGMRLTVPITNPKP
jgi:hypothetical protein